MYCVLNNCIQEKSVHVGIYTSSGLLWRSGLLFELRRMAVFFVYARVCVYTTDGHRRRCAMTDFFFLLDSGHGNTSNVLLYSDGIPVGH